MTSRRPGKLIQSMNRFILCACVVVGEFDDGLRCVRWVERFAHRVGR